MPKLETWEETENKLAAARKKHAGLRAKIEETLKRDLPPENVFDHEGQKIDFLLVAATKTSCLIKRPMVMLEGGGIPEFHSYHDWKRKIEVVMAPNKAKRKAYLTLFPEAEAVD